MNTGPGRKARSPPRSVMVPVMSDGSMSGVNCIRRNSRPRARADGVGQQGLGDAGHALEQDVATDGEGGEQDVECVALAHDDLRHLAGHGVAELGQQGGHPECSVRWARARPTATTSSSVRAGPEEGVDLLRREAQLGRGAAQVVVGGAGGEPGAGGQPPAGALLERRGGHVGLAGAGQGAGHGVDIGPPRRRRRPLDVVRWPEPAAPGPHPHDGGEEPAGDGPPPAGGDGAQAAAPAVAVLGLGEGDRPAGAPRDRQCEGGVVDPGQQPVLQRRRVGESDHPPGADGGHRGQQAVAVAEQWECAPAPGARSRRRRTARWRRRPPPARARSVRAERTPASVQSGPPAGSPASTGAASSPAATSRPPAATKPARACASAADTSPGSARTTVVDGSRSARSSDVRMRLTGCPWRASNSA